MSVNAARLPADWERFNFSFSFLFLARVWVCGNLLVILKKCGIKPSFVHPDNHFTLYLFVDSWYVDTEHWCVEISKTVIIPDNSSIHVHLRAKAHSRGLVQ